MGKRYGSAGWTYCLYVIVLLVFGFVQLALATLGEDVSSIKSDEAHFKAASQVIPHQFYSVQQLQTPSGTTIRQYISPAGTVFAVSWRGTAPDLQQLLGTYFDQYVSAATQPAQRGRGVHIDDGDLVVETGGHMRFVAGRAYLRSKMPYGITSDEIR